jgi:hypothetical protein
LRRGDNGVRVTRQPARRIIGRGSPRGDIIGRGSPRDGDVQAGL